MFSLQTFALKSKNLNGANLLRANGVGKRFTLRHLFTPNNLNTPMIVLAHPICDRVIFPRSGRRLVRHVQVTRYL
jgi:hypothetical protein